MGQKEKPRAKRKAENESQWQQQSRTQRPPAQNTTRDKHLQTLGLQPGRDYTAGEIKKAYRKAVMKAHPDAGGTQAAFVAVVNSWEWLRK